jgi:hypothetical protein
MGWEHDPVAGHITTLAYGPLNATYYYSSAVPRTPTFY